MSSLFLKISKSEETLKFVKEQPKAFLLLTIIALSTPTGVGVPGFDLHPGESLIRNTDVDKVLPRQSYRTVLKFLEKAGLIATRRTPKGTIVKLIGNQIYDLSWLTRKTDQNEENQPQPNHHLTENQPQLNHLNNHQNYVVNQLNLISCDQAFIGDNQPLNRECVKSLTKSNHDYHQQETPVILYKDIDIDRDKDIYNILHMSDPPSKIDAKKRKPMSGKPDTGNQLKLDFLQFDFEKWKFCGITEDDRAAWREAYPHVEVDREIARAEQWVRTAPACKQRKRQWRRFLTNWLQKSDRYAENRKDYLPEGRQGVDRRQKDRFGNPIDEHEDLF